MLDGDKAPEHEYTFTCTKTMLDLFVFHTHMYMSFRSYEILSEKALSGISDHLPIVAVFNVQSNQNYL